MFRSITRQTCESIILFRSIIILTYNWHTAYIWFRSLCIKLYWINTKNFMQCDRLESEQIFQDLVFRYVAKKHANILLLSLNNMPKKIWEKENFGEQKISETTTTLMHIHNIFVKYIYYIVQNGQIELSNFLY